MRKRKVWGGLFLTLEQPFQRDRLYLGFTLCCFLLALLAIYFKGDFNFIVSDGRAYYVYLPSFIIDGDLDFSNQVLEHWGRDFTPSLLDDRTSKGFVRVRYTCAFAFTLAPSFLISHGLSKLLYPLTALPFFKANGYSGLYQIFGLAWLMGLGTLIMMMNDRIISALLPLKGALVSASVILACLGSPFIYYFFREPFMVHLVSTFWVTLTIYTIHRLARSPQLHGLVYAGAFFAFGFAILSRPTNIWVTPFFLYLTWIAWRAARLPALLLGGLAFVLPFLPQLWIWQHMSGSWVYYSYQAEGFNWTHPALFETLLSSRHGLFTWSPLLLGAAAGWVLGLRQSSDALRPILGCSLAGFSILWYFNSAWEAWWFGDAFGARAFTELNFVFALGFALFAYKIMYVWRKKGLRIWLGCGLACGLVYQGLLLFAYIARLIPRGEQLF